MPERSLHLVHTTDPSAKRPNYLLRRTLAVVAIGVLAVGAVKVALGFESGSDSNASRNGNVPAATMDYLRSLPAQVTEIPEGGGIDDAAYAVDPKTFDENSNLRAGVEQIISDEVAADIGLPANSDENFVVPAHAKVEVPILPSLSAVPKDAR